MKLLRVVMWQCERMRRTEADDYLGMRLGACPLRIEHLVVSGRRVERVRVPCSECVLAKLYEVAHVLGPPALTPDGKIQFVVTQNRRVKKILREHEDEIVTVEEIDYRDVYLTPRQKQALTLLASGKATNITRLAKTLGITKPAALKLVRKSLRKLARRHTPQD